MNIKTAINNIIKNQSLSEQEMHDVMNYIMSGEATPAQIGGFLVALRMKGETVDEIVGAVSTMRELATPIHVTGEHLVDTCGTGGDGANLFNVSTACAFVVAAAGGTVAKHGNRSVSSSSGSADVLEALGIKIDLSPEQTAKCINELGIGFLFAPVYHNAMKHAVGPRRELSIRTLFNLLGPLSNPAGVVNQVIGVFSKDWLNPLAKVLKRLGSNHVLIVHSADGLDEISLAAETYVAELKDGNIFEYTITPEQFGIATSGLDELMVDNAEQSHQLIKKGLSKNGGKTSDIIAINAGAAIYAANLCQTFEQGVHMAQDAICSGLAKEKITELTSFINCMID